MDIQITSVETQSITIWELTIAGRGRNVKDIGDP